LCRTVIGPMVRSEGDRPRVKQQVLCDLILAACLHSNGPLRAKAGPLWNKGLQRNRSKGEVSELFRFTAC
jgi:hypothetical protein